MSILSVAIQNMLAHENRLNGDTTPVKPHIRTWQKQISDRIAFSRFMLGLELKLTHSTIPTLGTAVPSFTRATTETGQKWDDNGYLDFTALAGEIVFKGARREYNQVSTKSADNTVGSTISANVTAAATTLTMTAANGSYWYKNSNGNAAIGRVYQCSADVSSTVDRTLCLRALATSGTNSDVQNIAVTSAVQRVNLKFTSDIVGVVLFGIENRVAYATDASTTGVITFTNVSINDITGETDQTTIRPYVSVGALIHDSQDPNYVDRPVTAGHTVATSSRSPTGSFSVTFDFALTDYTPTGAQSLLDGRNTGVTGILVLIETTGKYTLFIGDGATLTAATVVTAPVWTDNTQHQLRIDWQDGVGATFFYDGVQSGSQVALAKTLVVGAGPTLQPIASRFYRVSMTTGVSATPFFDLYPARDATTPTGTITSSTTGEVWTINGASSVVRNAGFHGSMVDGVKCYDTDRLGNPIATTGSYPIVGYVPWEARTNLCLQSNAPTTAPWGAIGTPAATQNAIGPDGATSAWTLTDNDAGASEGIYQDITLTAAAYTFSAFFKKTTGAQDSYPLMLSYAGAVGMACCTIDTSNGAATLWTAFTGETMASGMSVTCTSHNTNYWRVALTKTGTAAVHSHVIYAAGTTNAAQSTGANDVAAQGSAVFYGAMVNLGAFAGPYVPTTTVAVARNADLLTYTGADISALASAPHTIFAEIVPRDITSAMSILIVDDGTTNNRTFFLDSAAVTDKGRLFVASGGVGQADLEAGTMVNNTPYRMAGAVATNSARLAGAGSVSTEDTSVTLPSGLTTLRIGLNTSATSSANCPVRNVRIWNRALSSSELQAITS